MPADLAPRIHFEHVHRYALAAELVRGRVLDLASGAGYGAAQLAMRAERVVGLDRDVAVARHAARKYSEPGRVEFVAGDACSLPFAPGSFDGVICFETIEHVAAGGALVTEAARVLKSPGTMMVSSPIASEHRRTYPDHTNPFHVHEYEVGELRSLLSVHFRRVELLGQRLLFGSVIWPLNDPHAEAIRALPGPPGDDLAFQRAPLYSIAVSTNATVTSDRRRHCSRGGSRAC